MTSTKATTDAQELAALLAALEAASSVLIACHVSPDGDTLGSALALRERLERMGKRAVIGVDGEVPQSYRFLPGWETILSAEQCAQAEACALAVCVDVSSPDRAGAMLKLFEAAPVTALIDHHPTNPRFAGTSLVDGDAPATALVVWRLFSMQGLPLSQSEAVCLYTALATDTGNFVYESTNSEAFHMMGELMDAGLDIKRYSRLLFRQKGLLFERALCQALLSLETSADGRVAGLVISQKQLDDIGAKSEHTDNIVDYAIDLEGVRLGYFLREGKDGSVKASLRALAPYRVDTVASRFSGGGHLLAAGCTLHVPLSEARKLIFDALTQALGEVSE